MYHFPRKTFGSKVSSTRLDHRCLRIKCRAHSRRFILGQPVRKLVFLEYLMSWLKYLVEVDFHKRIGVEIRKLYRDTLD